MQATWALFLALGVHVKTLGGDDAQAGAIVGFAGLSAIAATPIVGLVVDRFGHRPVLVLGGACILLGSLVFACVSHLSVWLYVARISQGIGFAAYQNAALSVLADVLPLERRAQGFGLFGVAGNIALLVAPPIAERLVQRTGSYQTVFVVAALSSLGAVVAAGLVSRTRRWPADTGRHARRAPWARRLRLPFVVAALQGAGFAVLMTFVPTDAQSRGVGFSSFFVAHTATVISTRLGGGTLADRARGPGILSALLFCWVAAMLLVASGLGTWSLLAAGITSGFGQALLYPALAATVLDRSGSAHRARALGLSNLASSLGGTLSVMACGVAADLWGYRAMFALAAAGLALGAGWVALAGGGARSIRRAANPCRDPGRSPIARETSRTLR